MEERMKLELNKIYNMDCVQGMKLLDDCSVDLTVTSPPYDNLRTYNGFTWDFETIAKELYRVTKHGGVVVWVVNDATIKGSETGTSFRQALYFKEIGFNLHDTMIWEKTGSGAFGSVLCYAQNFEYMFVFSKGKPNAINLIKDRENVVKSGQVKVNAAIDAGKNYSTRIIERKPFGKRTNIWKIDPQKKSEHPAPFPEQLAQDHIISWSNEGDLVLDPFMGSGTTAKMALLNNRNYIGFELDAHYCDIANERIQKALAEKAVGE
jgi:site-specific DNA-methyltransferase (adenine-specific)